MTLEKHGIPVVLARLARRDTVIASNLYAKLMSSWGRRPDRQRVTVRLGDVELALLRDLNLPDGVLGQDVLGYPGWVGVYRYPSNPNLEVVVKSKERPPKRRMFTVGRAKRRLVLVSCKRVKKTKEVVRMARAKSKAKQVEEDELDELEGLEDLEDLEDDEDLEEPDDEVEDEDEEEEEPAPKRTRSRSKAAAKKPAKAKSTPSRGRKKAAAVEEDDDEDEDEAPAPKRGRKAATSKASTKDKAPAKKSPAKSSGNGGSSNLPATRELPRGQVGPQDIAEMVGGNCDARYVRIWLRDSDYEREDGSRWSFNKGTAREIAKQIKRDRSNAGAE